MPIIRTYSDWWDNVDKYWPDLRTILYKFLPVTGCEDYDGMILVYPLSKEIEETKEKRSDKLARYLNAAWGAAPDVQSIHDIPGWGVLCDLCSEEYVLHEEC